MHTFRLWAPAASRVDLLIEDSRADGPLGTRMVDTRGGAITIVASLASTELTIPVAASSRLLMASHAELRATGGELRMPPDSVAILE